MTVEFDIKQGTEPDLKDKKKKTFTFDIKIILGWWMFLVSVAGWMFYLGIIVGRESAPVYFDVPQIDADLMELIDSAVDPEINDVVLPETAETHNLEFYEILKGNKGGNKKIAEIEDTLKYKPKTEEIQPEKFSNKTGSEEKTADGDAKDQTKEEIASEKSAEKTGPTKKAESASLKNGDKKPDSAKDAKSDKTVQKTEKKPEAKKAENDKSKSDQSIKNAKAVSDIQKTEQQKKDSKTSSDKARESKTSEIRSSAASNAVRKTGNTDDPSSRKIPEHQKPDVKKTEASKTQASEKGNTQKQPESGKPEKIPDKPVEKPKEAASIKTVTKPETRAEKKEPHKSGKYTIQAGAVKTREDADSVVKKLSASGIGASVIKGKGSDGSEWYRIRIGSYPDREKAIKMAETVKSAGFPAMVINVPQE